MDLNMKNKEEFLFSQKYRPKTISECILPDRLKDLFQSYVDNKQIPHLLLHGNPGSGKTTAALALCNEIGLDWIIINGSDENGIDTFRGKIKNFASSISLTGKKKVIIIDEADYLNATSIQPALRNGLEEFSNLCSFIFTCNYPSKIIQPLHSRCAVIDFNLIPSEKIEIAKDFFRRVEFILKQENIKYDSKVIVELIKKYFPDFRRVLNELQRYSQFGNIDSGILTQLDKSNFKDLIKHLKNKGFSNTRKWIEVNISDSSEIYSQIYDELYDIMKGESIPNAVLIIADYSYKSAFVADHKINLAACIVELMISCEFI